MVTRNPKTDWLMQFVGPYTIVITTEDLDWWKEQQVKLVNQGEDFLVSPETKLVLGEVLQKLVDPVEFIVKSNARNLVVTVPNEYGWNPEYKPFQNANHKWLFDADLLASTLEAAGFTYILGLIEFSGWSFLCAQGARTA